MKTTDKTKVIEKLLDSHIFEKNDKYSQVLRYLLDCYYKQYVSSEYDIAGLIYGKNHDFDPSSDSSVRGLLWKLRKKIADYYRTDGKYDKIRVKIPKRHYSLEFYQKTHKTQIKNLPLYTSFSLITALFLALLILVIQYPDTRKILHLAPSIKKNNFLWGDFLNSKTSPMISIGHIFRYCEYQDEINAFRIVRNRLINSENALSKYISQYNIPDNYIWIPHWDSVPFYTVKYFRLIQSISPKWKDSQDLKTSTKMAWTDFLENNIIYIGHFHNLNKLARFYQSRFFYSPSENTDYNELVRQLEQNLENVNFLTNDSVQIANDNQIDLLFSLYHKNAETDSIQDVYKFENTKNSNYVKDYVILTKLPGPDENNILFIISFHQLGRLTVIDKITDPVQIKEFEKETRSILPEIPKYFEMLIEVKGYRETAMEMEILHFYPRNIEYSIN
jgi:hypothetical protein